MALPIMGTLCSISYRKNKILTQGVLFGMNDYLRESLSYFGLYKQMFQVKKKYTPASVSFGEHKDQYFLFYEPKRIVSDKVIVWIHGGGWNAGNPKFFDYVGQCVADHGYRFISIGYRLSPKNKYPTQIEDVCKGFNSTIEYLKKKGIDTSRIIVAGPSAGAHLASIMCYCRKVQEKYKVDVSSVAGFIGSGGPYSFRDDQSRTISLLLNQLFKKGYTSTFDVCILLSYYYDAAALIMFVLFFYVYTFQLSCVLSIDI